MKFTSLLVIFALTLASATHTEEPAEENVASADWTYEEIPGVFARVAADRNFEEMRALVANQRYELTGRAFHYLLDNDLEDKILSILPAERWTLRLLIDEAPDNVFENAIHIMEFPREDLLVGVSSASYVRHPERFAVALKKVAPADRVRVIAEVANYMPRLSVFNAILEAMRDSPAFSFDLEKAAISVFFSRFLYKEDPFGCVKAYYGHPAVNAATYSAALLEAHNLLHMYSEIFAFLLKHAGQDEILEAWQHRFKALNPQRFADALEEAAKTAEEGSPRLEAYQSRTQAAMEALDEINLVANEETVPELVTDLIAEYMVGGEKAE